MNLEDDFGGTWYGTVFEYNSGSDNALSGFIYRDDLTLKQAQECRAAFEPPFVCTAP